MFRLFSHGGAKHRSCSGTFSKGLFLQIRRLQQQTEHIVVILKHKGRSIYFFSNFIGFKCCIHIFVPRFRESAGTFNLIRPFVCQSVCLSVTKTLTLAITFALLQVELWYLACVFIVTLPFWWYHVVTVTVTFDLLQAQICCRAGGHNSLNLLVLCHFHAKKEIVRLLMILICPIYGLWASYFINIQSCSHIS